MRVSDDDVRNTAALSAASVMYRQIVAAAQVSSLPASFPVDEACRACYDKHYPDGEASYAVFSEAFHSVALETLDGAMRGTLDLDALYRHFQESPHIFDTARIPPPPKR